LKNALFFFQDEEQDYIDQAGKIGTNIHPILLKENLE
jgi:hypothetical protein